MALAPPQFHRSKMDRQISMDTNPHSPFQCDSMPSLSGNLAIWLGSVDHSTIVPCSAFVSELSVIPKQVQRRGASYKVHYTDIQPFP
jgi:hypothetical protein